MRAGFSSEKMFQNKQMRSQSRELYEYLKVHMSLHMHMCLRCVRSSLCSCRYFHSIWVCGVYRQDCLALEVLRFLPPLLHYLITKAMPHNLLYVI